MTRIIKEGKDMRQGNAIFGKKKYLITLQQRRSVIAMIAGVLILSLTFMAIIQGVQSRATGRESLFHYFTVLSNIFSAVGAAFMIPYAVEGIRRKRFVLPRWVVLFQYCGALGVFITFTSAVLFILPVSGIKAVTGMNFWLHLVTPILTVLLFGCVETGVLFSRKEMFIALIPYFSYMAVYFVMVILVGKENGGWDDIYHTASFWPAWISAVMMIALGLGEAALLRFVHNRRARQSQARLTALWTDDMEPVELMIEAFGLGRYMAGHSDESSTPIPLDILKMMSERYGVPVYDLAKAYLKGVCDMTDEKENRYK